MSNNFVYFEELNIFQQFAYLKKELSTYLDDALAYSVGIKKGKMFFKTVVYSVNFDDNTEDSEDILSNVNKAFTSKTNLEFTTVFRDVEQKQLVEIFCEFKKLTGVQDAVFLKAFKNLLEASKTSKHFFITNNGANYKDFDCLEFVKIK